MSEVIVRMEMPERCCVCKCRHVEFDIDRVAVFCGIEDNEYVEDPDSRPSWCPICGVLPDEHGDLIDRDALRKYGMMYRGGIDEGGLIYVPLRDVMKSISNAPTVIAAEREDNGTTC